MSNYNHRIRAKIALLLVALLWSGFILLFSFIQIPITIISQLRKHDKRLARYVWGFWIWQDQAVNAILGGNPDVTISSKVGYLSLNGSKTARVVEVVIDCLFKVSTGQENHCFASIEKDEEHYNYFWR